MKRLAQAAALAVLLVGFCLAVTVGSARAATPAGAVQRLMWTDLVPPALRGKVVYSPPPLDEQDLEAGDLAQLQPSSLGVRPELAGKMISIPGFVVPLDFDAAHRVTRFFLVPYFGACIHFPPPPADQMIYVTASGFELKTMYDPFLVTGVLQVAGTANSLGTAEYTLQAVVIEPYKQ